LKRPRSSSPAATKRMLSVRRSGTHSEIQLAREFRRLHVTFKTNVQIIPGKRIRPDFIFPKQRVAIFLDGCFWHACPDHGSLPKANRVWWKNKLTRNQERDVASIRVLRARGWVARRFWTHETPQDVATKVIAMLKQGGHKGMANAKTR